MKVIENELVVATDIDDTLACWDNPTVDGPGKISVSFAGKTVFLTPHVYHIDLIKMYKERGYFVIAWSANGNQHCKRIIEALGLKDHVDICMSKLAKHLDDNADAASILGPRVFCDDLTKPKSSSNSITFQYYDGLIPGTTTGHGTTANPFPYEDSRGHYYIRSADGLKVYQS